MTCSVAGGEPTAPAEEPFSAPEVGSGRAASRRLASLQALPSTGAVSSPPVLETERLVLRGWRLSDREPFAALNADPRVMEHFPETLDRAASDALADRIAAHFTAHGFGLWAVEVKGGPEFAGFTGLTVRTFAAHFTPCVEVAWRLAFACQGRGYAIEAACAAVAHGFEVIGLNQIVSYTVPANRRSLRVMEKLGMRRDPDGDFDHPKVPREHRLARHVLYRLDRLAEPPGYALHR